MQRKQIVAVALVLSMMMSGCLSYDGDVEVPDVVLPEDWSTITVRSVASPQLIGFEDCNELEQNL